MRGVRKTARASHLPFPFWPLFCSLFGSFSICPLVSGNVHEATHPCLRSCMAVVFYFQLAWPSSSHSLLLLFVQLIGRDSCSCLWKVISFSSNMAKAAKWTVWNLMPTLLPLPCTSLLCLTIHCYFLVSFHFITFWFVSLSFSFSCVLNGFHGT